MAFNDLIYDNGDATVLDDQSLFECAQFVDLIHATPTFQCSSIDSTELMPLPESFLDNDVAWNQVQDLLPFEYYPPLSIYNYTFDQNFDIDCFSFTDNAINDNASLVKSVAYDKEKEIEKSKSKIGEMGLEEMRKYFNMPIMKAAMEMNVGVTLLKKRCRQIGISRWPHRKMKSLNNLILNIQELEKETGNECVKRELEILKERKRMMEENPLVELTEGNKKLRQACFKANYKKKKAKEMLHPHSH